MSRLDDIRHALLKLEALRKAAEAVVEDWEELRLVNVPLSVALNINKLKEALGSPD